MFHDVFYRLHLFNINGVSFVSEEVAQEEGGIFSIYMEVNSLNFL